MASDAGDNLFDSILMADNRFHNEGYQEGFEEGVRVGLAEGRSHGAAHGAKVATEVSFYYGFALTWKCLLQNSTDARASKRLKTVESLIGLIQRFPHDDPSYENLQEDMERVRAKFRQTCSLLNVPVDFRDYVNGSHGLSF
ncbi:protein LTO1 homolog [Lepisosteus oculatus]|uniref:protein LTO1 homolog n=1 Tax=Lepisosteus oculatus TaxID=7918 RepID=UPI0035F508E8